MDLCLACSTPLAHGTCPTCPEGLPGRLAALDPARFPATSLPPAGLLLPALATKLRLALVDNKLEEAESLWAQALASLRPTGSEGRKQVALCLHSAANLAEHRGKAEAAQRLRQRAALMLKDPSEIRRKQAVGTDGPGWDQSAWLRLQAEDAKAEHSDAKAKVLAELAQLEEAAEKRLRLIRASILAIIAGIGGSLVGIPALISGLVGAGLGWAWPKRA